MTKIAIYGDSFACMIEGWPRYLQQLYGKSEITTFGVGGTNSDFSYMKFLETHEKYDIVIFLWANIARNSLITKNFKNRKYYIYGFTECFETDELKDQLPISRTFNKTVINYINEYIKIDEKWVTCESFYLKKYPEKNFLSNLAMRDSVKLRRPDAINIECSSNCPEFSNHGMGEITIFEWCKLISKLGLEGKVPYDRFEEDTTKRLNHLSIQQNKEFAKYLYKHMNEKDFNIHDTFANPKKYYTISETLEESGFIM